VSNDPSTTATSPTTSARPAASDDANYAAIDPADVAVVNRTTMPPAST
jgi:hypothetical protein